MTTYKKKLIEVALPLEAINAEASLRKRKAPAGYPTTIHKWWAQRPLAAARAVIFAQMVDDPSEHPDIFKTEKSQDRERLRLFRIIEELILWENSTDEKILQRARDEIWQSWRYTCASNSDHPRAKFLFDRHQLPGFHDPFAGGASLPLEAQRLGLVSHASDLNPVAVLINKAIIEIPQKFAGWAPINQDARTHTALIAREWHGAQGLAEDVRYYGKWMSSEAEKRIGHLFPSVEVTRSMVKGRPDLKDYAGQELRVTALLWARTVKSPNPAFAHIDVPLVSSFVLSTRAGNERYLEPIVDRDGYRFNVKAGKPSDPIAARKGTKLSGANFVCIMSGVPITGDYLKAEGKAKRMGTRLMAIVAEGKRGRIYLSPTDTIESVEVSPPSWQPEGDIATRMTGGNCVPYGLTTWSDLFTTRQLVTLSTFSDLVAEARQLSASHGVSAGLSDDGRSLAEGGEGAAAYSDAIATYLAMAISRLADYGSSIATWRPKDNAMRSSLAKQAIPMTWDFAEGSPFGGSSAGFVECVEVVAKALSVLGGFASGNAEQESASGSSTYQLADRVVSTDPPYYDNIGYADLSDFFYVWLRASLKSVFPSLFSTLAVPKEEELVATAHRHGGKEGAERFFLEGMTKAMRRLLKQAHPAFPVTIYYAFKQAESDDEEGTASTGWDTFLEAVLQAGFAITGTWPMRTEGDNRQVGVGASALASSIVLVCRTRDPIARDATRREFVSALKSELPGALTHLRRGNIAPVDLAQAAIGSGMAIYTRYTNVLDAAGQTMSVREALGLINQTLDEVLSEQEGDFDADSRWALTWFDQVGFAEGEYGLAEQLSKSKNTSVDGMVAAGIIVKSRGKVRLLKPSEMPADWDPMTDPRLTAWEVVHQLVRSLASGGEAAAATLVANLGSKADVARELAYRLYTVCERKKRATEALSYNALVQSWPEISRLALEGGKPRGTQTALFDDSEA